MAKADAPGSGLDEIVYTECPDVEDGAFDRVYRDVLEVSFRPSELDALDDMRTAFCTPVPGRFGTIAFRSGEPVGVALGEHDFESGVMLLGYVAVRSDQRGRGVGSGLLSHVLPLWRESVRPVTILAEVEDPRCYEPGPYGDPVARLRMYDRGGWRLVPVPYFQPALGGEKPRVRGMLLISFGADRDEVPSQALVAFLDTYFATNEGMEAIGADPEYLGLRKSVSPPSGRVQLWPISRASEVPVARP